MAEPSPVASQDYTLTAPDGTLVELPVREPTLGPATLDINALYREQGVFTFDPGFVSTASCESGITFINGEEGTLLFRGYPIEALAENCGFLEVASLLLRGELPSSGEFSEFRKSVAAEAGLDESVRKVISAFARDAHPMAVLTSAVAALAGVHHAEVDIRDERSRAVFAARMIAKMPTVAAAVYRHARAETFVAPRADLGYTENLLYMFFGDGDSWQPEAVAARALDLLFVLHADHEQNASTSTVRLAGSSGTDPYAAIAAGCACLWGPAHGGANQAVLEMLGKIGSADNIETFVARAKDKDDPFRLMGFGHRVYKNYDPRAKIIRSMTHELLEKLGMSDQPLLDLALALEKIALEDDYFVSHKLYPNVDFYSGIIYKALGIPADMFTVMFAIGRSVGWVAQWCEMMSDPKMRIGRPRQLYMGSPRREFLPLDQR